MKKINTKNEIKKSTTSRQNHRVLQGFVNRSIEEQGSNVKVKLNPTYDFEELKTHREDLYESSWLELIKEDRRNEVPTNESSKILHRKRWLKKELGTIERWISLEENSKLGKESTIIQIEKYNLYIQLELEKINQKTDLSRTQINSYKWHGNLEVEVVLLYNKMLGECISNETTLEQFKEVFSGQILRKIHPVKWIASKNLLAYFVDTLYSKKKLKQTINPEKWKIAEFCFTNGKNLSQTSDLYKNNKKGLPRDHHLIDNIVNNLF